MLEKTHQTGERQVLLGDEAVALGAVHAGVTAAYGYPGTPSTEILEYLIAHADRTGSIVAQWSVNEKTAYEEALGVSMAGRRALVSMKHVGLNVAADPFMNSALVSLEGGLVLAVADDPGMHSSQNEQDSRYYADFARMPCLEPGDQQEAYTMTREAFELSERLRMPVMVRLVTRLAHSRAVVSVGPPRSQNPIVKAQSRSGHASWILVPANARRQWRKVLERQPLLRDYAEKSPFNALRLESDDAGFAVVTAGIARNYLLENVRELEFRPSHLHVGVYPAPAEKLRALGEQVDRVLVLEDGYPFLERMLRGLFPGPVEVLGRMSGQIPEDGELTPDRVRAALGLVPHRSRSHPPVDVPVRPPQLCQGCPHCDAFDALNKALEGLPEGVTTSDIGCYSLGALPPYSAIETCVCMGASVSMAMGAAQAGMHPVVAVIGDSTFLHSGVTPLMDAAMVDANMTIVILDNEVVAMTGAQPSLMNSARIEELVLGAGVAREHCHAVEAHPRKVDEMAAVIRREVEHQGLSVVISTRECIQAARARRKAAARSKE